MPDLMVERKILWLAIINGMTVHKYFKLMDYYGDIENVWDNFDKNDPNILFLGEDVINEIEATRDLDYIDSLIKGFKDIKFVSYISEKYPRLLKEIASPPIVLYYRGEIDIFRKCISIVGSRKCSEYGLNVADDFAYKLASNGVTIVSGGARGIDSAAHIGALNAGGKTAAIFGCGVDVFYPRENKKLFLDIVNSGGCLISEYKPGVRPLSRFFPIRNRIISGISSGVLVIEAEKRSGTKITADLAVNEGRDVFCIPGSIYSRYSEGTNQLIKQGAKLVSCCEDILEEYNWKNSNKNLLVKSLPHLDENEQKIVNFIEQKSNITVDHLSNLCNIDIVKLNSILTMMEIKGIVKRKPGNIFTL